MDVDLNKNPFLEEFLNRVGFYNTSIFQIQSHLKEFAKFSKNSIPDTVSPGFVMPILGAKLIYRNLLTGKNQLGFQNFTDVSNVDFKVNELIEHYSNYCVAQSFEAFETLIKDLITHFIITNQFSDYINIDIIKHELNVESYEKCRSEVWKIGKKDNKYNKQYFNFIYKIKPRIEKIERKNFLRFNFYDWNIVLTEIRHSIVHSNGIFNKNKTANWTDFQFQLLNDLFTKEILSENRIKISTKDNYEYIIKK